MLLQANDAPHNLQNEAGNFRRPMRYGNQGMMKVCTMPRWIDTWASSPKQAHMHSLPTYEANFMKEIVLSSV